IGELHEVRPRPGVEVARLRPGDRQRLGVMRVAEHDRLVALLTGPRPGEPRRRVEVARLLAAAHERLVALEDAQRRLDLGDARRDIAIIVASEQPEQAPPRAPRAPRYFGR